MDDDCGWLVGLIMKLLFVAAVVAAFILCVCLIGVIIGGFYSIKDYVLSFKENVVDNNLKAA